MAIQFHLDESVDPALAKPLRAMGVDVTTPHELALLGAADLRHVEFALGERRVIVTHDRDYLRLNARGILHAGIVYCHQGRHSLGDLTKWLVLLAEVCAPDEFMGHVEFL